MLIEFQGKCVCFNFRPLYFSSPLLWIFLLIYKYIYIYIYTDIPQDTDYSDYILVTQKPITQVDTLCLYNFVVDQQLINRARNLLYKTSEIRVGISKLRVENSATRKKLRVDILNVVFFFCKNSLCILASIVISAHYFLIRNILRHHGKH
jgi:hypothetical protein